MKPRLREGARAASRDARGISLRRERGAGIPLPFAVVAMQQFAAISLLDGPIPHRNELAFLSSLCAVKGEGWGMSSYASYCQDQATACARRARLASSPEIVAYCRNLQSRWLRLAAQAQATGGALGRKSASAVSLDDKTAAPCPAEYGKLAGELIARGARSLRSTLRQNKLARPHAPSGA